MKMKRLFARISATVCVSLLIINVTGCFEENHPGTYYTFTGETIADYLSNRESYFSSFIEVLKKFEEESLDNKSLFSF